MRLARRRTAVLSMSVAVAAGAVMVSSVAPASASSLNRFKTTRYVTDATGGQTVDPNLVNPWGMSQGPDTPVWVSDNGKDVSTVYKAGASPKVALTVSIPSGEPTGQVYNGTTGFKIAHTGPATFIFDSEAGVISAWNSGTSAVHERTVTGAVFKGLAMGMVSGSPRLFATDFHNGQIDVFSSTWKRITSSAAFVDSKLPAGYAPFGIAELGGKLVVSYAKQDAQAHDDASGVHRGYVDVFTNAGVFVKRLISRGSLDSPWGLALAPATFGPFGGALLVGNFGNGRIHAYNPSTGAYRGTLKNTAGHVLELPGLWGLLFGNGTSAPKTALMFTSGPGGEAHGRWGTITAA
jgi:uncharacterized protein (TIGR03118 family)